MPAWGLLQDRAAQLAPLLFTWFDLGATAIVLIVAGTLLAGMFMFIRIASDDSDRYKVLKEMVETLFGTPAHLKQQPEEGSAKDKANSEKSEAPAIAAFSEPCPACSEKVTERDPVCPSCGLQLL
jgi:hypothetical protein